MRKMFAIHIAGAAIYSEHNPLSERWLLDYIAKGTSIDRKEWASAIFQTMHSLESESIAIIWAGWMKKYWQHRIASYPVPIDNNEAMLIIQWVLYLSPVFSEAVENACLTPIPSVPNSFVIWKLAEDDYAIQYPQPVADLLLHLLKHIETTTDTEHVDNMVRTLADTNVDKKKLHAICNELARLGYVQANELADFIDKKQ